VTKSKGTAQLVKKMRIGSIGLNNIEEALEDKLVKNYFVCARPETHYTLAKKLLQENKNVFIEKPPCLNLEELDALISMAKASNSICMVGMQKRYAPSVDILRTSLAENKVITYKYSFAVGPYPEGDCLLDVFLHSIDFLVYLFGECELLSVVHVGKGNSGTSETFFLHLKHGTITGSVELSTHYSWGNAQETLVVNAEKGIFTLRNLRSLVFVKKTMQLFSIPIEKLMPYRVETVQLYDANDIVPIMHNNQINTNGYYQEIHNFVKLCEGGKAKNVSTLKDLRPAYEIIEQIKSRYV
jgi:virulence factor